MQEKMLSLHSFALFQGQILEIKTLVRLMEVNFARRENISLKFTPSTCEYPLATG